MMTTGIVSSPYFPRIAKASGIIRADSAALARSCDGRSASSLGKPLANFAGILAGRKILRISTGHRIRARSGAKV